VKSKAELVNVDGLKLNVSVQGEGPPLLLLNGLGARVSLFDALRAQLPQFQTITFDQPGIGDSEPRERLEMSDYATLATKLLDVLGFSRPVDVLGVSWGGCLAQELAFRHPSRVRRLILASTTASPFVLAWPSVYVAFLDSRRYHSLEHHRRIGVTLYGGPMRDNPALMDTVLEHLDKPTSQGRRLQQQAALGWTSLPYLWRLRQSTLVLAADDDPIIRSYNSYLLSTLIPTATRYTLPNEGHLFLLTSARETAVQVTRFLQSNRATAVSTRPRRRKAAAERRETISG
jgi:poly(3-hydroxyoctanoate) depolymerase